MSYEIEAAKFNPWHALSQFYTEAKQNFASLAIQKKLFVCLDKNLFYMPIKKMKIKLTTEQNLRSGNKLSGNLRVYSKFYTTNNNTT